MDQVKRNPPDFILLFLTILLVCIGLCVVFSASSMTSIIKFKDAWHFETKQLMWACLGMTAMFFFMNLHYLKLRKWYLALFAIVSFLLVLVILVGTKVNGHRSWFGIGSFGIQPTEFAKLALVIYLAALITKKGDNFYLFKKGLLPVIIIIGLVCGLIMMQPDIGSVIVIVLSSAILITVGGANVKHLLGIVLVFSPLAVIIVSAKSYRMERFTSYLNPWKDTQGSSYQLVQSIYAFAHGGVGGAGFGRGIQKAFYLPEAHTDFIFSVIGEELGLIGSVLFLLIYLLLIWRGIIVSLRCSSEFGTLVGIGIISMIAVQALINLGGVTGSIPITGVPLPFISYGGSSLLFCLSGMGILLNISRDYKQSKQKMAEHEITK